MSTLKLNSSGSFDELLLGGVPFPVWLSLRYIFLVFVFFRDLNDIGFLKLEHLVSIAILKSFLIIVVLQLTWL